MLKDTDTLTWFNHRVKPPAAVFHHEGRHEGNLRLPEWFCQLANAAEGESPIFLYELCAAILMVYIANEMEDGTPRTCVLRVDNMAAGGALVKGSSSSKLGTVLANLFWNVAARGTTRWWIEYVNTKSNAADFPSRICALPIESRCSQSHGCVPKRFSAAFSTWDNIRREATFFAMKNGI